MSTKWLGLCGVMFPGVLMLSMATAAAEKAGPDEAVFPLREVLAFEKAGGGSGHLSLRGECAFFGRFRQA